MRSSPHFKFGTNGANKSKRRVFDLENYLLNILKISVIYNWFLTIIRIIVKSDNNYLILNQDLKL